MKRKSLFVVVLVVGLAFSSGMSLFAHRGDDGINDDQSTVSGTVSFKRPGGYFLQTDAGEEYKLDLGPIWRLERIGLELKQDDRITVTGFKNDDGFILVNFVEKGSKNYDLNYRRRYWMHGGMMDRYDKSYRRARRWNDHCS